MLSYFLVENYKCLELVEFPLTPIHVLIGPNDSGKTSVLEAMLTYMRSTASQIPVQAALPEGWEGNELVYHGAPSDGTVNLTALTDRITAPGEKNGGASPRELGYGFSLSRDGAYSVSDERLIERREGRLKGSKFPQQFAPNPAFTTLALALGHGKTPEELLKLPGSMFGPASLYSFDPKVLAIPAVADVNRKFRMDPDGFGLSTLLDDILGHDADLFLQLRKSFLEFFPQIKAIRVETAVAYKRDYGAKGVHSLTQTPKVLGKELVFETQWGGTIHARQASDGALLFLAFLALVHLPASHRPKLVLVEEPERGVYPKKLEELIQALKKWVQSAGENAPQIVMATHSPYVLSFFAPEEVTFLSRAKGGGVRARPLRSAPNIHERLAEGYYLGELWYNLTEQELFGDAAP